MKRKQLYGKLQPVMEVQNSLDDLGCGSHVSHLFITFTEPLGKTKNWVSMGLGIRPVYLGQTDCIVAASDSAEFL